MYRNFNADRAHWRWDTFIRELSKADLSEFLGSNSMRNGRGAQIRTEDPLLPKQVRYQAAPRPDAFHFIAVFV